MRRLTVATTDFHTGDDGRCMLDAAVDESRWCGGRYRQIGYLGIDAQHVDKSHTCFRIYTTRPYVDILYQIYGLGGERRWRWLSRFSITRA